MNKGVVDVVHHTNIEGHFHGKNKFGRTCNEDGDRVSTSGDQNLEILFAVPRPLLNPEKKDYQHYIILSKEKSDIYDTFSNIWQIKKMCWA